LVALLITRRPLPKCLNMTLLANIRLFVRDVVAQLYESILCLRTITPNVHKCNSARFHTQYVIT